MNKLIILFVLLFSPHLFAGEINNAYGVKIFGIKWGETLQNIKKQYPKGKFSDKTGIPTYTIKDSRPFLGVDRGKAHQIVFYFDSNNKFNGGSIDFSYKLNIYSQMINRLQTNYGEPLKHQNSELAIQQKWPKDNGVEISTLTIPGIFGGIKSILFFIQKQ